MGNFSNSASTSLKAVSANTCCAAISHRLRRGAPSWRIMPSNWSRLISSPCLRSASRFFTFSWFWPMTGAAFYTSTLPPTRPRRWTGQQLREAFPFAKLPRYLLRDRDAIFGHDFREQVRDMGICEVLSAPRSPWQRAYVERVIGSIRRECLDHMIVFQESSLRRTLKSYFEYYHRSRTHLSLGKDAPEPRAIQPPEMGSVVAVPQVGGLHHRYERRAA